MQPPPASRPRLFVDRVFTISGAGTVATGTLSGDCLAVGEDVALYPRERTARIRSLQTHERSEDRAPVTRVAANLVGTGKTELARGDVIGLPGTWRPTTVFEATLRPVRGLAHPITGRGAFKVHAGAAEADARLRIYGDPRLEDGAEAFVRITTTRPLVLDVFDRFVLRESDGRRPSGRTGAGPGAAAARRAREARLARRAAAREELPAILADERGAVRASEATALTGASPDSSGRLAVARWRPRCDRGPARVGRRGVPRGPPAGRGHADRDGSSCALDGAPADHRTAGADLLDALLDRLIQAGRIEDGRRDRLVVAASRRSAGRPSSPGGRRRRLGQPAQPPTVKELVTRGIERDAIDAAVRAGSVVRVAPDLVFASDLIDRAQAIVSAAGTEGITVSAFREALGTTRKYAMPILEWFDQRGITRRSGDLRFPRASS